MSDQLVDLSLCFGSISIQPWDWVQQNTAGLTYVGQRSRIVEYDFHGNVVRDQIAEPASWLHHH